MIKRQRGRGRNPGQKPQNNNPNRAYESNGPDLKVRGSAQTVFEKYQQLGRDCQSNGDRVLGENYMQHAEHYFRVLRAMQPTFVPRTELMIAGYEDEEYEGDEQGAVSGGEGEGTEALNGGPQPEFQQNRPPRDSRDRDNRERDNRDRNNNRDRDNNRPPREFRDNREPRENREPRDQNDVRNSEARDNEPRNNEPRGEGEEGRYGRRRRRPDRPERFGNDGGAPTQNESQGDQGQREEGRQDSRYEGRREPRSEYRGEGGPVAASVVETPVSFNQPEFAQPSSFSDPQEISVASQAPPPRARPPRPPRAPRAPRAPREASPDADETGFGTEMPAFLAAPVPAVSGD
jgi:Domain of unknown function (DUF4167)